MDQGSFKTNLTTRLLRAGEVAEVLNISKSLAYKLIQGGVIPSLRIRHSVRVREEDLIRFIESNLTNHQVRPS